MKEVSDFISSVGFPIVVCLLMIYQQQKMSDSYINIVDSLKELISDNTKAINILIDNSKNAKGVEHNYENGKATSVTVSADKQAN